jgi:hypothetical protein
VSKRYDFSPALRLEQRIEEAEEGSLRGRWEFGRWMLEHVPEGQKKLPDGFLAGLEEATGCSRAELKNRRQFAAEYDPEALAKAISQSVSWYQISNVLLGERSEGEDLEEESGDELDAAGDWETPPDLLAELDREFHFAFDVRSLSEPLREPWRGICFCHPPTGPEIERWVAKAERAAEEQGTTLVCLLPARVDAEWWWEHCVGAEIRFLRGRLRFGNRPAPFPSAIVVFGRRARVRWWRRAGSELEAAA